MFKPVRAERKDTTAQKLLNAEEISELSSSPYVANIISGRITFSSEFKRVAYDLLVKGTPIREIFETHGIDPEIFGKCPYVGICPEAPRQCRP